MLALSGDGVAIGAAGVALVGLVWLARELALAHRWRRLIGALDRLATVLDELAVVILDELDDDAGPGDG